MARAIMAARGASDRALDGTLDLKAGRTVASISHASRKTPVSAQVQIRQYDDAWKNPRGSWLMVIGSIHDEDLAITAALGLMWQSTIKSAVDPRRFDRPFFWRVFGGSYDKLRQSEDFRVSIAKVGMLVLSNVAINSSPEKIEKIRDILSLYSEIPRIVTVVGCDPLTLAVDSLHMNPDRVLYLNRKAEDRLI